MNEQTRDSLAYLTLSMQDAAHKQKENVGNGLEDERVSGNPVVEALMANEDLYKAFLKVNTAKAEFLEGMRLTQDYEAMVDADIQVWNLCKTIQQGVDLLGTKEWKALLNGDQEPRVLQPGSTRDISYRSGSSVLTFGSGAELSVDLRTQMTGAPVVEGYYKDASDQQKPLKRLPISDTNTRELFLQVMEQRLSALVVQMVLTKEVAKVEELSTNLQTMKRNILRSTS